MRVLTSKIRVFGGTGRKYVYMVVNYIDQNICITFCLNFLAFSGLDIYPALCAAGFTLAIQKFFKFFDIIQPFI